MGALDLYADETQDRLSTLAPVKNIEAGAFDGFLKGAVYSTMQGFARTARAVDLLGSIPAILEDKINAFKTGQTATGITEAQDKYFREHDEIYDKAINNWTLRPGEVGVAGEVVGGLISMLPLVITSPALAVATTQLGTGEDLVKKGVSPEKAVAVGAVEGAGLGLGIWLPVLGVNGWQRIVLGGAGFNALQGVATRGVAGAILEGEKAGEDYKAFDPKALTLDVLLGAAFGTLAHLSPAQRAQGREAWQKIEGWAKGLQPSEVDAIAALRQAQHLNVDSSPGTPEGLTDIQAHTDRMRTAIDQVLTDKAVQVDDMPAGKFEAQGERWAEAERGADRLKVDAEKVATEEGIHPEQRITRPEQAAELKAAAESARLERTEGPSAPTAGAEPPPPRSVSGEAPRVPEADPVRQAADRFATEQPDLRLNMGTDADGKPITKSVREFLDDARAETAKTSETVKLFEAAATCLFGGGR